MMKKWIVALLLLVIAVTSVGVMKFNEWKNKPIFVSHAGATNTKIFNIKSGSHIRSVITQIQSAGIPLDETGFEILARLEKKSGGIKAGTYELKSGETPQDLIRKLIEGKFVYIQLRFIEGWTFKQFRQIVDAHEELEHTTHGWSDAEILKAIGAEEKNPEGLFFPDTYFFMKNSKDIEVYKKAYDTLKNKLSQAWGKRDESLPYKTPYEALTMASIIEKETGKAEERRLIAAVFVNRLQSDMLLQTDPTVIYGIGERFDGNIRKSDLTTDTPYNTYTRKGLPPTPIALPSEASIKAALHPEKSKALYFVAKGDGSSYFSSNLDEHNRAVNQYQRAGR